MTNRIDAIFAQLRRAGTRALMPFITAGYPDLEMTAELIPALEEAGASICEIGIPFSDPIADGPVIAASMHEALVNGFDVNAMFESVRQARPTTSMGLVAMVSYSIVHRFGLERFVSKCAEAGFDGFIFPDLPVEESDEARIVAEQHEMTCSLLVAPNTSPDRAGRIARACTGFVYLLARVGITGERSDAPEIGAAVKQLRAGNTMTTPIACGFGIASAEAVRAVVHHADAAIVGSAIVRRISSLRADGVTRSRLIESVGEFIAELASGLTG